MLILLFVKLGCSFNLEDGICIRHIHCLINLKGKKCWLCEDLEKRNRAFQEDRAGDCQETQELRRICCAEADRARQLKYDEPSTQKEDNPSAVNQFMVQIQELQDKVNSLTDAKEFHDPETASSTGLSSFIVNP